MKIKHVSDTTIIFDNFEGELMNNNDAFSSHLKMCGIDIQQYDSIYKLKDNWAGRVLLVRNNVFRYIQFGSGRPILYETEQRGILE